MAQAPIFRAYDEVASFFARGPSAEEIATFRLSDRTVERVRDLLEKNSTGTLTTEEQEELDDVGQLNRMLLLIRSRIPRSSTPASEGAQEGMDSTS